MKLEEAIRQLPDNLNELLTMYPKATPMSACNCPVACFLSEKTGKLIAVDGRYANEHMKYRSTKSVMLPERVQDWIHEYDTGWVRNEREKKEAAQAADGPGRQ